MVLHGHCDLGSTGSFLLGLCDSFDIGQHLGDLGQERGYDVFGGVTSGGNPSPASWFLARRAVLGQHGESTAMCIRGAKRLGIIISGETKLIFVGRFVSRA